MHPPFAPVVVYLNAACQEVRKMNSAHEMLVRVTADVADTSMDSAKIIVAAKHGFATLDRQSGGLTYVNRIYSGAEESYR